MDRIKSFLSSSMLFFNFRTQIYTDNNRINNDKILGWKQIGIIDPIF